MLLLENVHIFYAVRVNSVCRFRLYSALVQPIDSVPLGKVQICLFSMQISFALPRSVVSTNDRTHWSSEDSVPLDSPKRPVKRMKRSNQFIVLELVNSLTVDNEKFSPVSFQQAYLD
jgi:hypothetical protein